MLSIFKLPFKMNAKINSALLVNSMVTFLKLVLFDLLSLLIGKIRNFDLIQY